MNKRIEALQECYNAVAEYKAVLANAAVFNPSVSALLSERYNLLGAIQNEIYEELQKAQQEEQETPVNHLQALLNTLLQPQQKSATAMQDESDTPTDAEEEKKDREATDKIVAILQERANIAEKPVNFRIELSRLGFAGMVKPEV